MLNDERMFIEHVNRIEPIGHVEGVDFIEHNYHVEQEMI